MTPILYEKTENNFTTYGIGALSDIASCVVTEERNGQYECIFTYPITGNRTVKSRQRGSSRPRPNPSAMTSCSGSTVSPNPSGE